MKHPLLASTLIGLLVLLTGCNRSSAASSQPPRAMGFSCTMAGTYRGEELAGTLQRSAAGLLTVELTAPETLEGLTMTWDGETVGLRMLGLEWNVHPDTIPQAALGARIMQALDAVIYGESEGTLTDEGKLKTTGTVEDTSFTLYSDPESGHLLSLEIPSEELTLTFADFQMTS